MTHFIEIGAVAGPSKPEDTNVTGNGGNQEKDNKSEASKPTTYSFLHIFICVRYRKVPTVKNQDDLEWSSFFKNEDNALPNQGC